MLPNNTQLKNEVAADIKKVRDALSDALATVPNSEAAGALAGMQAGIDRWANDGTTGAASATGKAPGANGWSGWTNAGMIYLKGIEDLVDLGRHDTLDAITATVKQIPAETVKAAKKAAKKVADTASDAAHEAVHVAGALGGFFNGLLGKVAIGMGVVVAVAFVLKAK